jgi:hypothetical protein
VAACLGHRGVKIWCKIELVEGGGAHGVLYIGRGDEVRGQGGRAAVGKVNC